MHQSRRLPTHCRDSPPGLVRALECGLLLLRLVLAHDQAAIDGQRVQDNVDALAVLMAECRSDFHPVALVVLLAVAYHVNEIGRCFGGGICQFISLGWG